MAQRKRRYFDVIAEAGGTTTLATDRHTPTSATGTAAPGTATIGTPTGGAALPPRHVGELLRWRREELGHEVRDLSQRLRIRQVYLEAIEGGRFRDLPGQAYVIGFLRSYSEAVDLDPSEILKRFKEETTDVPAAAELYFPEPVNENRVPGGAVLLISLLLAGLAYGGWYALSGSDRVAQESVPALPERLADRVADGPPAEPSQPATVLERAQAEALVGQSQPTGPEVGSPDALAAGTTGQAAPLPSALPSVLEPATPSAATQAAATQAAATEAAAARDPAAGEAEDSELPPVPEPVAEADPASGQPASGQPASGQLASGEPTAGGTAALPDLPPTGTIAAPPSATAATDLPADLPADPTSPSGGTTAPSGRVFGQAEGAVRVELQAAEQAWVEIRDAKGTLWASRVLRPGDVFRAPPVDGLTMVTGNAGGLVVSVDGQPLPPLGAKGEVKRDVLLDPDSLRRAAAATPGG